MRQQFPFGQRGAAFLEIMLLVALIALVAFPWIASTGDRAQCKMRTPTHEMAADPARTTTSLETICWRGNTIQVQRYQLGPYIRAGACYLPCEL